MTNYFARRRKSTGAWLDAILADHARATAGGESDLRGTVDAVLASPTSAALLVVDMPAPARAYAALIAGGSTGSTSQVHILDGQPSAVARALFSQMAVQARLLSGHAGVAVYGSALSERTRHLIETEGAPYGVRLVETESPEPAPASDPAPAEVTLADGSEAPTDDDGAPVLPVVDEPEDDTDTFEEVEPLPERELVEAEPDAPTDEEIVAELSGLTIAELRSLAGERGVHIPKDTKKADIIALLVTDARG